MIRIVIVVAGLVLVEVPKAGGPFDIYFPETDGFNVPVLSLASPNRPRALPIDDHRVDLYLGMSGNRDEPLGNPAPFRMEIQGKSGTPDLGDIASFPDLGQVIDSGRARVRDECQFDNLRAQTECKARDASSGLRELLAGQLRLSGSWKLLAFETESKSSRIPMSLSGRLASRLRLLIDDEPRASDHPKYSKNYPPARPTAIQFADTFVFATEVDNTDEIVISGGPQGAERFVTLPPNQDLEAVCKGATECHVLWIENAARCRLNGGCEATSAFFKKMDIHLPHVYRLLQTYDQTSGLFADEFYVPFGAHHLATAPETTDARTPRNDSSPRCYGGVVQP